METSSYAGPVSVWLSVPSLSMLKTASIIGSLTQVATQQARIQNVALVLLYNLPKHDRQPSSNETWAHGHRGTLGGIQSPQVSAIPTLFPVWIRIFELIFNADHE